MTITLNGRQIAVTAELEHSSLPAERGWWIDALYAQDLQTGEEIDYDDVVAEYAAAFGVSEDAADRAILSELIDEYREAKYTDFPD